MKRDLTRQPEKLERLRAEYENAPKMTMKEWRAMTKRPPRRKLGAKPGTPGGGNIFREGKIVDPAKFKKLPRPLQQQVLQQLAGQKPSLRSNSGIGHASAAGPGLGNHPERTPQAPAIGRLVSESCAPTMCQAAPHPPAEARETAATAGTAAMK